MPIKFGQEMGRAFPNTRGGGVPFYSSHYDSADPSEYGDDSAYVIKYPLSDGTLVSGLGWAHQCVGGARCGLIHLYDTSFPSVGMAYTIFDLPYFERLSGVEGGKKVRVERVPVIKCANGAAPADPDSLAAGAARPFPGMLLIWHAGGFFSYTGHVAQIVDVVEYAGEDDGSKKRYGVRIAESNYDDEKWVNGSYSRELPAKINAHGHFEITEPHPEGGRVKGWIGPVNMLAFESPTSPTFSKTAARFSDRSPKEEEEPKQQARRGGDGGDECC